MTLPGGGSSDGDGDGLSWPLLHGFWDFPWLYSGSLPSPGGGCCCSYDLGGLYILELSCLVPLHPGEIGLYLSQNFCPVLETCTKSNMCMLRLLLAFASAFSPCGLFLCFFLGMDGFSSALT